MRVLIVDDEPQARARLQRLLTTMPGIEIVGTAKDGEQALAQVAALAPDVVFLDIQMPGISGLDVAASLPDPAPALVFATAFDRYALDAFDSAAVDYLLKPVEAERLARTLDRLRERLRMRASPARAEQAPPAQLLVPDRGRTHVVAVAEIAWLEAADNYVVLHLLAGRPPLLLRRTLAGLLADLGPGFVRTHRGAAVALAQVLALREAGLTLRGGASAPCSRPYRAGLLRALNSNTQAP
ncbi:MAG: response regulator transcription factor [Paucibacter sp.]|nr:response regulator transcription factor [Roseateles sp.]